MNGSIDAKYFILYMEIQKGQNHLFLERLFSSTDVSSSVKGEVFVTGHLVVILISQNSKEYLSKM